MPILIVVCGIIATGKSTVAKKVSGATGIELIRSDRVRKELAGMSPEEHAYEEYGEGIYTPEFSKKTYEEMMVRAKDRLSKGSSVILDATFSKKWQREAAKEVAVKKGARFLCIETVTPNEVIKERAEQRTESGESISDGRLELLPQIRENFEKIDELEEEEYVVIDTSKEEEEKEKMNKILEDIQNYL
ncbi:MAG: AAA family ATPase [Archaeoglobaceae archaeon]